MRSLSNDFLRGSYPPLVTPFGADGAVDYDAYARLVDSQIQAGTHGIVINGTSAEPSTLTVDERNRLVDVGIDAAAGRVPVVAATGSQSFVESAELTEHATKAGADALLIVTPYYIRPPQRGLTAYYTELSKRTDKPWMIYHIPGRTAVAVTLDTLKDVTAASDDFVGIKHAVNDLALVSEMLQTFGEEFRIFVGLEELSFPMLCLGAAGMMNAVANVWPEAVADLYESVAAGDLARGRALHYRLWELNKAVFFDTNPIPVKSMMRKLGLLPLNTHRLPMMPAASDLEQRLDTVLQRAGLLRENAAE
ncbi:4-hydroxy-tetrahydrodipicolinate synthase [Oceanibacterium hippocampi]|uniref:4-hydroxy-tetrahydrodipicolinate synthase n=1 Tax=Oceanibacterium hippocampi TaxID=745714 RepID=A0A1Y5RET4_9PROT|nr:4-hydroxy-tetrahydrodipicolinate synthase [Oceanibacterium hippocampi]SLN13004.1 4-hydroxy-tetrahydrodipicolinate synthase [Oceanibacterium hippocampi]